MTVAEGDGGGGGGGRLQLLRSVFIDPPYGPDDIRSDNETVLRRVVDLLAQFDAA